MRSGPSEIGGYSPVARLAAILLLVLGTLPIADWIPGGHATSSYLTLVAELLTGSLVVAGLATVTAILVTGRTAPALRRLHDTIARLSSNRPIFVDGCVALLALIAYAVVAATVYDARPLFVDEITQRLQADIFLSGRLWAPSPAHPEFTRTINMVDTAGRTFSQFPPGGPFLLMLGALVGAPWIAVPMAAAAGVCAFGRLARRACPGDGVTSLLAIVVFAFAPFALFMSASEMNHAPALALSLLGAATLARAADRDVSPSRSALLAGCAGILLGTAATFRPVDAVAFAIPAAAWLAIRALGKARRPGDLAASGIGIAIPIALLLWYNARTTGRATTFGYTLLWGASHDLGFHRSPWGTAHTPLRGLELLNVYTLDFQRSFLETPIPSLALAIAALAFARRPLRAVDRYLLAASALTALLYAAYWHRGVFAGPRFFYGLLPMLALWTARVVPLVRSSLAVGTFARRLALSALAWTAFIAAAYTIPLRARQYACCSLDERWDVERAAREAGIHDALILVRESWGAQLVARMWALGISAPAVEAIYPAVDACELEERITRLEALHAPPAVAERSLIEARADSARLTTVRLPSGATVHADPARRYTGLCLARVQETAASRAQLPALLVAPSAGNTFVRDLHARDSVLSLAASRPIYLVTRTPTASRPAFGQVSRDSLRMAWSQETAWAAALR